MLNKIILIGLLSILLSLPLCSCQKTVSELIVTAPEDHVTVNTSIIRVSGQLSGDYTQVIVADTEIPVAENGSFSSYTELSPGLNEIQIVARLDKSSEIQTRTVTFIPSVSIAINAAYPDGSTNPNMVTIAGYVYPRMAEVTIDNNSVPINDDGTFFTSISLEKYGEYCITAVASLDGQTDESSITLIREESGIVIPPGQHLSYRPKLIVEDTLRIAAGQHTSFPFIFETGKTLSQPEDVAIRIQRVEHEYGTNEIALPEGFEIAFGPNAFTAYPLTSYEGNIVVASQNETTPERCFFLITVLIQGNEVISKWITVEIE